MFTTENAAYDCRFVNANHIIYDDSLIDSRVSRMALKSRDWQARVKGILKAELKCRDLSYRDLAKRLDVIGVKDSERNISNKIARGSFTAVFFVQCLNAIGCHVVNIEDI